MECDIEPYALEEPVKFLDSTDEMDSQFDWTFANNLSLYDSVFCIIGIEDVDVVSQKSSCMKIK